MRSTRLHNINEVIEWALAGCNIITALPPMQDRPACTAKLPDCCVMQVIGIVTRKDVAEANAKLALGRKANLGLTTNSDSLTRPDSLPFIPYGAYDPTVGSSHMSHMEPIDERDATDGIEMNYTLDGEWQNSRPQPVERRSGRRGRDDTDTEHSPLLDRSPGSGNNSDAV